MIIYDWSCFLEQKSWCRSGTSFLGSTVGSLAVKTRRTGSTSGSDHPWNCLGGKGVSKNALLTFLAGCAMTQNYILSWDCRLICVECLSPRRTCLVKKALSLTMCWGVNNVSRKIMQGCTPCWQVLFLVCNTFKRDLIDSVHVHSWNLGSSLIFGCIPV